jgi:hypothetical protein
MIVPGDGEWIEIFASCALVIIIFHLPADFEILAPEVIGHIVIVDRRHNFSATGVGIRKPYIAALNTIPSYGGRELGEQGLLLLRLQVLHPGESGLQSPIRIMWGFPVANNEELPTTE